jgi:mannose-6-phosphate isomerase-like protein (cupin superfamily)
MDVYELTQVLGQRADSQRAYLEFLRVASLSLGVYVLPAGGVDPQNPHTEDEVYYVVGGRGTVIVADEERRVGPGSIIFVAAGVEHRFHTIEEELTLLVFFAPPEYSQIKPPA